MNHHIKSMYCIRCGRELPVGDYPLGCPDCLGEGHPSSLSFKYGEKWKVRETGQGMKRYAAMLPYEHFVSLGEGQTPVIALERLAAKLGLKGLYVKNEFQNPTGSHKDRMNPFVVARAVEMGYQRVAAASSGNEGASLASYAAAAGVPCTIVADQAISEIWKRAILSTGAQLILTETAGERWDLIREKMETNGWFSATNVSDPPVGSCSFGVQGYKTIAYEIYEALKDKMPDTLLIPVTRGDLLWGVYEGFCDLAAAGQLTEIPRLIAVEPFERIERIQSLEDCARHYEGDSRKTPSIGGSTVTVQSLLALKNTGGFAVSVAQDQVETAVGIFGKSGLYLEGAAALAVCALEKLINEKRISKDSRVMIIATSHGYKNILD